eukprot:m51a1_g4596 hypothetical protein (623) ;mRNA; r:207711-210026
MRLSVALSLGSAAFAASLASLCSVYAATLLIPFSWTVSASVLAATSLLLPSVRLAVYRTAFDAWAALSVFGFFASPLFLSLVRPLERLGLAFYARDWDDWTPSALVGAAARPAAQLALLRSWDVSRLDACRRVAYEAYEWWLEALDRSVSEYGCLLLPLPGAADWCSVYTVHQMLGPPAGIAQWICDSHKLLSVSDLRDFAARAVALHRPLAQVVALIRWSAACKRLPPECALAATADGLLSAAGDLETSFVRCVERACDRLKVDPAERSRLVDSVRHGASTAAPQLVKAADLLRELAPTTLPGDGLWRFGIPGMYEHILRTHVGLPDATPEGLHDIGLQYTARLLEQARQEMVDGGFVAPEEAARADFAVGRELERIISDEEFRYTVGQDEQQCLADFRQALDEATEALPRAFGKMPPMPIEVAFSASSSSFAFAMPGLGSTPGTFFVTPDISKLNRASSRAIAFHEGIPGHVLERGLTRRNRNISFFLKNVPFYLTAFLEGWALYVESVVCKELGLYKTSADRLGQLQMVQSQVETCSDLRGQELMRAARLVVDTGIHAMHWDMSKAVEFLVNSGLSETEAESQIGRYIVMPGQACSYAIGQMKIVVCRWSVPFAAPGLG